MNRSMRITKVVAAIAAVCAILLTGGYCAGRVLGSRFMEDILLKEGRFPLLLSRPVNRFYEVYTLIHSGNPYSRLGGYYGLADNGMINLGFLAERFRLEEEAVPREVIIWIAAGSGDTDGVLRFYSSIFHESSDPVKRRILEAMRRVNNDYYRKFVKKNRIDARLLPGDGRNMGDTIRF